MNKLELMRHCRIPAEEKYKYTVDYIPLRNNPENERNKVKVLATSRKKAKLWFMKRIGIYYKPYIIISVTQPHKTKTYAPIKKETDFIRNFIDNIKADLFGKTTK